MKDKEKMKNGQDDDSPSLKDREKTSMDLNKSEEAASKEKSDKKKTKKR